MTLDQILGTYSVPLEHDGLTFRLVPFTNARVLAWNRATHEDRGDMAPLERAEKVMQAQLDVITAHMRDCVTDGKATRVTAKWVSEQFPQAIIEDLATFFANGSRPTWAGDSGN